LWIDWNLYINRNLERWREDVLQNSNMMSALIISERNSLMEGWPSCIGIKEKRCPLLFLEMEQLFLFGVYRFRPTHCNHTIATFVFLVFLFPFNTSQLISDTNTLLVVAYEARTPLGVAVSDMRWCLTLLWHLYDTCQTTNTSVINKIIFSLTSTLLGLVSDTYIALIWALSDNSNKYLKHSLSLSLSHISQIQELHMFWEM